MIEFYNIEKCAACGSENTKGAVACSMFGSYSGAFCEECLKLGRDIYKQMVDYISFAGHWPEDINDTYKAEVMRQLKLHGKTEEEFIKDVNAAIIRFNETPFPTYAILEVDIADDF
jgi:hypothetical protein